MRPSRIFVVLSPIKLQNSTFLIRPFSYITQHLTNGLISILLWSERKIRPHSIIITQNRRLGIIPNIKLNPVIKNFRSIQLQLPQRGMYHSTLIVPVWMIFLLHIQFSLALITQDLPSINLPSIIHRLQWLNWPRLYNF